MGNKQSSQSTDTLEKEFKKDEKGIHPSETAGANLQTRPKEIKKEVEVRSSSKGEDASFASQFETKYKENQPLARATKQPRSEAAFRITNGNVIAIDFGTTGISVAYTTEGEKDNITIRVIDESQHKLRVCNAILMKSNHLTCEVVEIGEAARDKYIKIRNENLSEYVYFEKIKMLLKRDEEINRLSKVHSIGGDEYYLVEVIAFTLKFIKNNILDNLSRTLSPLKATDFDWVITVPAIWDARGKRMMREAAYLAGLLDNSSGITKFTSTTIPITRPVVEHPDKLSLALEPEVAGLYCQYNASQNALSSAATILPTPNYIVVDIGGGTVDVTVHSEVNGGIHVESLPTGNCWGGTKVNEQFSQLLQLIVKDNNFETFIQSHPKNSAIINSLIYTEFESQKRLFGNGQNTEMDIELPSKFIRFYKEAQIEAAVNELDGVIFEEDALRFREEFIQAEFFDPILKQIISCLMQILENVKHINVGTMYLVGAFGSCRYINEKIKEAVKTKSCQVVVPKYPDLAVVQGAVQWRNNPDKIKARRADATYGTSISIRFNERKHDPYYRYYNEEEKCWRCKDVFDVFIEKGELVLSTDVFVEPRVLPGKQSLTSLTFPICSTLDTSIQYVRNKEGKCTVTIIGQLVIDIPNPNNLPREKRSVDITMDLSGTELQAKAKYSVTGEEVKTVCDFLSSNLC